MNLWRFQWPWSGDHSLLCASTSRIMCSHSLCYTPFFYSIRVMKLRTTYGRGLDGLWGHFIIMREIVWLQKLKSSETILYFWSAESLGMSLYVNAILKSETMIPLHMINLNITSQSFPQIPKIIMRNGLCFAELRSTVHKLQLVDTATPMSDESSYGHRSIY